MKTAVFILLCSSVFTLLHADDFTDRIDLVGQIQKKFGIALDPSNYTSDELRAKLAGTSPEAAERTRLADTLKLAGRSVDASKYSVQQLRDMVRYIEMTPAQIAAEQAQIRINEINAREQEAWERRVAPLAKEKGMTLAEYARWEMEENERKEYARIKAKEESEEKRQLELYKLWLMERQTEAAERSASALENSAADLSNIQFQQWLNSMAQRRR